MPTPREIALATNAGIEPLTEAEEHPPEIRGEMREEDYRANPVNPPDGALPATNLKK